METIQCNQLSFTYPLAEKPALRRIDLTIHPSEFVVICGKSGCGKSTLLRQLKKELTPYGKQEGQVLYGSTPICQLPDRTSAQTFGYVMQNPDSQIVTDKAWHELAFGLENLGFPCDTIKRRVAEMASYFGIQNWFRRPVAELSGGQKQLLNLASVMAMQPDVLLLDEPASQLDPIAASEFLRTIHKINRDLGTTIILSEHRLEEVFPLADRVIVMEDGQIIAFDTPQAVAQTLYHHPQGVHPMFCGLPTVMRIFQDSMDTARSFPPAPSKPPQKPRAVPSFRCVTFGFAITGRASLFCVG